MSVDLNLLYGIYELVEIEEFIDGVRTPEKAKSGMFTFTRDHRLAVVSGAEGWVMAYAGSFEVIGNILSMNIDSCVVREREGTVMTRIIRKLDGNSLILETGNEQKRAVISWKKKVSL